MIDQALYTALVELRNMEGTDFEKGYAGAPLFCRIEGLTPQELLRVIAIDLTKEDSDVDFNNGAAKWCHEQLAGSN